MRKMISEFEGWIQKFDALVVTYYLPIIFPWSDEGLSDWKPLQVFQISMYTQYIYIYFYKAHFVGIRVQRKRITYFIFKWTAKK